MSRFELRRRLGEGGFGVVFEAIDAQSGTVVALKLLREVKPRALYHFKREFRALANVTHENLVRLYELAADDDNWYFTMELVHGVDLLDWVHGVDARQISGVQSTVMVASQVVEYGATVEQTPLDPPTSVQQAYFDARPVDLERLRDALVQLAHGLGFLHESGKLHCDIKPNNVLVTREGQVKILDFGLVTDLADAGPSNIIAGTPAYMAPEAMLGGATTPAADWYSVGIVVYEALTGTLPFLGDGQAMVAAKLQSPPPGPRDLNPHAPRDLDQLCRALLDPRPERRPGRDALLAMLGKPAQSRSVLPVTARFVGRELELDAIERAFAEMSRDAPLVALVHGRSGLGKSALVQELLRRIVERRPNAVVLSGRCHAQETVPHKAFDGIVDALTRFVAEQPVELQAALTPPDARALARLFPVLQQLRAVAAAPAVEANDPIELRRRGFRALRSMLTRLAETAPLVLFIDDLHWGDADSAAIADELLRAPGAPALFLVGTYRTEEAADSALVDALRARCPDGLDLELAELAHADAEDLALALLGAHRGEEARAIAREARGSPFFIDQLARAEPRARSAGVLDQVIRDRVATLSDSARRLLEVTAVAGHPIPRSIARRAAELDHGDADELTLLRNGRFVRTRGAASAEQLETYHDRIREALVDALDGGLRQRIHDRLARALEADDFGDAETLAIHHEAAGNQREAARYFVRAAEQASAALAFERAARLYRHAIQSVPAGQSQGALRAGLGEALANLGRGAEAAEELLASAAEQGPLEALELRRRSAELLLNAGRIEQGLSVVREVLARVGMSLPRSPTRALASLLLERAKIRLRGLEFEPRVEAELPVDALLEADTCWSVASGLGVVDTVRGAYFQAKNLVLSLDLGEPRRALRALAMEVAYTSTAGIPARERTRHLIERTFDLARRSDDPGTLATVTLASAIAVFHEGGWKLARERAETAERLLRESRTGLAFQIHNAQMYALRSIYYLGDWRELLRRLPELLRDADERGDVFANTRLRVWGGYIADLARDDADAAGRGVAEAMRRWGVVTPHQEWYRVMAETEIALYEGDGEAAWRAVDSQWSKVRRSLQMRIQAVRIIAYHLRARTALAALAGAAPARAKRLREVAEDCARAIDAEHSGWGDPLALLIRASLAVAAGDRRRAVPALDRAERGLIASDMHHFARAAARLRAELDDDRPAIEEIEAWWRDQGMAEPARIARLLAPSGRALT